MYHINPACIKNILSSMPKKEFLKEFEIIKSKYENCVPGSNEEFKYKNLYQWCIRHYNKNLMNKSHY